MFRILTDDMAVAPQIGRDDVAAAAQAGYRLIINNRPDGEESDQPSAIDIGSEARSHGMDYIEIPVTHAGFSQPQVDAMVAALENADGPVLAFCRSGTRSCLLWALAQARMGADCDAVAETAAAAGYDVGPVRQVMDLLQAQA